MDLSLPFDSFQNVLGIEVVSSCTPACTEGVGLGNKIYDGVGRMALKGLLLCWRTAKDILHIFASSSLPLSRSIRVDKVSGRGNRV